MRMRRLQFLVSHAFIAGLMLIAAAAVAETPTDAELLELERQIEQQEAEEATKQKQAEAEARRRQEEAKRQAEEAETRRKLEAERLRAEQEAEKILEAERLREANQTKEQYAVLMSAAQQALENRDKNTAMTKYQEALALLPNDSEALNGIQEAAKLMDNVCYAFVGTWELQEFIGGLLIRIMEDGTFYHGTGDSARTSWTCSPERRQITENQFGWKYQLSDDGTCLKFEHRENCFTR